MMYFDWILTMNVYSEKGFYYILMEYFDLLSKTLR